MEHIPLHGFIRDTPSGTEVHAEHQLRAGVPDQWKRMHRTLQDSVGGKTGVLVGLDHPSAGGGTEAGIRSPHGAIV